MPVEKPLILTWILTMTGFEKPLILTMIGFENELMKAFTWTPSLLCLRLFVCRGRRYALQE